MSTSSIQDTLKQAHRVHFIGIGGVSMSALALILQSNGYEVSGSDRNRENLRPLEEHGIPVFCEQAAENIRDAQMVVYTAAIKEDNPELKAARQAGLPCYERADLLGAIMSRYDCPIGVAGTHGKSTTTSMISCVLLRAGLDPTISVGATLPQIHSNYHIGKKELFVFESCEYAGSFLKFFPKISVILNIDEDHLDFYKNIDDITAAFARYLKNTLPGGTVVTNAHDAHCLQIIRDFPGKTVTFGLTDADYTATDLVYKNGCATFTALEKGKPLFRTSLTTPGEHNVLNALAATAAVRCLGVDPAFLAAGLSDFHGAGRRFEIKGKTDRYTVIDDYAHHPTEIMATLRAARKMNFDKILLIFQPHTYSRTKALLPQFREALAMADHTLLCDIYAAREKDDLGLSSRQIAATIPHTEYVSSFEEAARRAKELVGDHSLILTMGAGDVFKTADYLL